MKKLYSSIMLMATIAMTSLTLSSCDDDLSGEQEIPNAPYVLSLGVTSSGNTSYYVVSTDNLMEGTINAVGKGIEQNGYHDYQQGGNTIFCIGGLGVANATGVVRGSDGLLKEQGEFVFNNSINILAGAAGFLLIMLYLFFILLDYKKLETGWQSLLSEKHRPLAISISNDLKKAMRVYFRAQTTIAFTVGVLLAIGFSLIKLPMAVTLGLFIGLLNIVPYLQVVGFIPALFLALLKAMETDQSFGQIVLLVLLVMAVVQIIQETLLIPKIMGKAYNMNPAIILLSLSVWGSLMGVLGMLLALPLTTLIFSYYRLLILGESKMPVLQQKEQENQVTPDSDKE